MQDARIILVEGMPGTGKSTVSQFINLQLNANGQPAYWCHEEHAAHPLRLFYEPARHLSWSDYIKDAVSLWQLYADEIHEKNQIAVLDAAILQNHVRSMLIFNCDRNVILSLVDKIENLILSLDPVLIYLKPKDIERSFRDVVEVRGRRMLELWIKDHDQYPYTRKIKASGYPGFIAFWEEFGEISDRIIEDLAISKLRQDVSNDDWCTRYSGILNYLELPSASGCSLCPSLERFTGKYVPLDNPTAPGFMLQARDRYLVALVEQPTINIQQGPIGCFREVRFIPRGKNHFYIAAWPHEVQFIEDGMGMIVNMQLNVSVEGWANSSQVYLKQ